MSKMHENELEIPESLVSNLLKHQCPQWADLPLNSVLSSGTDNALFRLGADYIVRLPRVEWEPGSVNAGINKEYQWMPKIAQHLKIPISEPLFKGKPDNTFPWSWIVARWNEGHNPNFEQENEYKLLAKDLAYFLNELHGIKLADGPLSRRGIPLNHKELDQGTRAAISKLEEELDIKYVTALWEEFTNVPSWNNDPVWIHGDFLPGNILIQNNRLSAVIDFADLGIGDPACDLVIAWALLNPVSRKIFRENLENIDNDTWKRGKGWALSIALIMLPYYKHSNLVLAALARRMIEQVLGYTGEE